MDAKLSRPLPRAFAALWVQPNCYLPGPRNRCCSQHALALLPASLGVTFSEPEALLRVDVDVSLCEARHHAQERGGGVRANFLSLTLGIVITWHVEVMANRYPGLLQP